MTKVNPYVIELTNFPVIFVILPNQQHRCKFCFKIFLELANRHPDISLFLQISGKPINRQCNDQIKGAAVR